MARSENLLRPPFHIPVHLEAACHKLSRQHDHFFRLCRTIGSVVPENDFRAFLMYKDKNGWYIFGESQRFPLSAAECSVPLFDIPKRPTNDMVKIEIVMNRVWLYRWFDELPKEFRDRPDCKLSECVAVFCLGDSSNRNKGLIKNLENNLKLSCKLNEHPLGLDRQLLLSDISDKILSEHADLQQLLNEIPKLVKDLLGVDVCSLFLKGEFYQRSGLINSDKLYLAAHDGYQILSEDVLTNHTHELKVREGNDDTKKRVGITPSIVIDDFDKKEKVGGKLVLLNHRVEIGGYNPGDSGVLEKRRREISEKIAIEEELFAMRSLGGVTKESVQNELNIVFGTRENIGKNEGWDERDYWHIGKLDHELGQDCNNLLGVPILMNGESVGCLKVENRQPRKGLLEDGRFSFQDLVLLNCSSKLVSLALQKQGMIYNEKVSLIDKPVFTPNYLFNYPLKKKRDNSHYETYTLVYIDVDNFKMINDLYGHAGGDVAMKELCGRILDSIKKCKEWNKGNTILARVGGDEFVIVGLDIPEEIDGTESAKQLFEAIRIELQRKISIKNDLEVGPITISMGCIRVNLDFSKLTYSKLRRKVAENVDLADTAAKISKWSGKNQLVYFEKILSLINRSPNFQKKYGLEHAAHSSSNENANKLVPEKTKQSVIPIVVVNKIGNNLCIINAGLNDGVFVGLKFEVKADPEIKLNKQSLENNFNFTKAQLVVQKIYDKISLCKIYEDVAEVLDGDWVEIKI